MTAGHPPDFVVLINFSLQHFGGRCIFVRPALELWERNCYNMDILTELFFHLREPSGTKRYISDEAWCVAADRSEGRSEKHDGHDRKMAEKFAGMFDFCSIP